MDKGLKLQVELSQKGEQVLLKIIDGLNRLEGNSKMLYQMANGIKLCITENHINILLVLNENKSDGKKECGVGIITNPFEDRIIAKEAICCYLINNPKYYFKMDEDTKDDTSHRSRRYHFSTVYFNLA